MNTISNYSNACGLVHSSYIVRSRGFILPFPVTHVRAFALCRRVSSSMLAGRVTRTRVFDYMRKVA